MAVTIDTDGATTYFATTNHINANLWFAFSDDQHTAAVAYAKRQMTRQLGSEITSETVDTNASYQPDYACYEQALYLLTNSDAIADGTEIGPKFYGDDGAGNVAERRDTSVICKEARLWMDWQSGGTVHLLRGA